MHQERLPNGTTPSITTLLCNPRYVFYHVNITTTPEGVVLSSSQTSTAEDIPSAKFNFSFFEEVMSLHAVPHSSMNTNFPVDTIPQNMRGDLYTMSPLIEYGLALRPANYSEYLDQSILQQTFEAVYNSLFISAFHSLNFLTSGNEKIQGTMVAQKQAITIVE